MECNKCHLNYNVEDIKKFTCEHTICKLCFYNTIIKELINNINDITKTYSINCKCNKGILNFNLDEIKNIKIPLNLEENKICLKHEGHKYTMYNKTTKTLLCDKCNENPDFKNDEKIQISELKYKIKEQNEYINYRTYDEFKTYIKEYLSQFIEKCNNYYNEEISKLEALIEKIKNFEINLKKQMEAQIEKETILFNLIDKIYEYNYKNFKIFNDEYDKEEKYGYRFYKNLSKVKFDFGEFGIEHQEEIIPELENIITEFNNHITNKKFKTSIKYPYFELIKKFVQINDIKQESIISCLTENKKNNEIFVGYRDYSINVFHPKNSSYEIAHTLKSHKGEITSLLYIDDYLISGSKDRTLRIWNFNPTDKIYKIAQVIRLDKEIKKINKYIFESYIGFLVSGEENNFRLFLKKENIDEEKNAMEIEKKNEDNGKEEKDDKWGDDDGKDDNGVKTEEIFKIEQVLSDHDNEVCEAIQIANNNDIVSGSKDMTIIVWKDCTNSLQYECSQIISAGNEVEALCLFGNKGFAAAVSGSYEIKLYELNNAEGKYENICSLSVDFCHDRSINQIILLKDNRIASCSYDSTVKILSYNSLTNELREDQELDEQNLSVNGIIETANGKLITGGHGKHLMIYKRN